MLSSLYSGLHVKQPLFLSDFNETWIFCTDVRKILILILILLTWSIWWAPNNARKWQMEFNSALKGFQPLFLSDFNETWIFCTDVRKILILTLILLTWSIWWAPNNARKWRMGFNSAFKGFQPLLLSDFNETWTFCMDVRKILILILILLTWRIWWAPNNARKWQMGFNSAFKGLNFMKIWEAELFRADGRTDR